MNDLGIFDKNRETHIWPLLFSFKPLDYKNMLVTLSQEEKNRAKRFIRPIDSYRYIVSHCFLRSVLAFYLEVSPEYVEFDYQLHGKPILKASFDNSQIFFNLSHSREAVLVACCKGREVGVDIEYKLPVENLREIAKTCMTFNEYERWMKLYEEEKISGFYRCWVLKEAYLKGIGTGLLKEGLISIEIEINNALYSNSFYQEGRRWYLQEIKIFEDYASAVAFQGTGFLDSFGQAENLCRKVEVPCGHPLFSTFTDHNFLGYFSLEIQKEIVSDAPV